MHKNFKSTAMTPFDMMRRMVLLVIVALLLPSVAFAQKGHVDEFREDTSGLLSIKSRKKDKNGKYCSLIKVDVRTPQGVVDRDVIFTGDIVDQVTLQGTQYWVYVPTSGGRITLESNTMKPLTVTLQDFSDITLAENMIYLMEVSTQGANASNQAFAYSLRLTVAPGEASVFIDGKEYELRNGQVDIPVGPGLHNYTISCNNYKTEMGSFMMHNKHYDMDVRLKSENGAKVKGFKQGAKWGFKDQNGKTIVQPRYDKIFAAGDLFWVVEKGKYGMFDNEGNQLTPFAYKEVIPMNEEGIFKVQSASNNKYGIVDSKGHLTASCVHEDIVATSSPMYVLIENGRFGMINPEGQIVLSCIFDQIVDFRQGYAKIAKDGKIGFINTKGEIIIPCQFEDATFFSNGVAEVRKDGYVFKIDTHGNRISD